MWATISSGQVWQGEVTNQRKDGTVYAEEMQITPVQDPGGKIVSYIAIKRDVTQKRAGEEAQRLLAAIVESSTEAVFAYTPPRGHPSHLESRYRKHVWLHGGGSHWPTRIGFVAAGPGAHHGRRPGTNPERQRRLPARRYWPAPGRDGVSTFRLPSRWSETPAAR